MNAQLKTNARVRPEVSFVIPVYNKAAYLPSFIKSLNRVPFISEFIFVDDGSTDKSADIIAQALEESSASFRLIRKENGGVSAARNVGISYATGNYISFLDPDDEVSKELSNYKLGDIKVDFIAFSYTKIDSRGRQRVSLNLSDSGSSKLDSVKTIACKTGLLNACWAKLYKREVIERYGLRFPEGVKVGEDIAFNLDFLNHALSCEVEHTSMVDYYVNQDSASARADVSLLDDAMMQVERRNHYSRQWGLSEQDLIELEAFNRDLLRGVFYAYARSYPIPFLLKELERLAAFEEAGCYGGKRHGRLLFEAIFLKMRGLLTSAYRKIQPVYGRHV